MINTAGGGIHVTDPAQHLSDQRVHVHHAGKGLTGDQSLCYKWFWRSSQQYVPEATYKLAQCKEDGWGCAVNLQEAVALYKEAAEGMSA